MREIIEAALRRQRTTVLLGLAVGLAGGLFAVWARGVGGVVHLLALLPIPILVGMIFYELFRWSGTEGLRVDGGARAFYAPPRGSPRYLAAAAGYFAYQGIQTATGPGGVDWLVVLAYAVVGVGIAVVLWRRVPFVALTAEGVSSGAPHPQTVTPWEALGAGAPVGPGAAGRYLRLPVVRPELVRRTGWGPRRGAFVPVRELTVSPGFLSAAIRHYVAHPEHRSSIGTPEEYSRLRHALVGTPMTDQV